MARDYDPVQGQWYEDLEENEIFRVLSVDPDEEIIEVQYENGDIEEIDLDTWHELDLERAQEPEGWASDDEDEEDEEEEDEDDETGTRTKTTTTGTTTTTTTTSTTTTITAIATTPDAPRPRTRAPAEHSPHMDSRPPARRRPEPP